MTEVGSVYGMTEVGSVYGMFRTINNVQFLAIITLYI